MTNSNYELPIEVESDAWVSRHNKEMSRRREEEFLQSREQEKKNEERRQEWLRTPENERRCSVCNLKLSPVDVARIAEKPTLPRYHEGICNPFDAEMISGVAKGLVSMLKEVYGGDDVPLSEYRKLVEAYKGQHGRCHISQIRLSFPVEEKPIKSMERPSSVSPLDHARMEHERQKEQEQRMRAAELHAPSIDFDSEGKLRLVSKTVTKWREGLTDQEFVSLIQTLHDRLPALQKYQSLDIGTTSTASRPQRSPSY